jgi:chorismate mutase / prephenate dehydratase
MSELRHEISAVDDELVAAVNRRLDCARRIFEHKEANGIPILDAGREDAMIARLQGTNGGPLSDGGVAELVRYLLDLTKRELGRA